MLKEPAESTLKCLKRNTGKAKLAPASVYATLHVFENEKSD